MYHYLSDRTEGTELPKLRVRPEAFAGQCGISAPARISNHRVQGVAPGICKRAGPCPNVRLSSPLTTGARECLTIARDILKARDYMAVVFPVSARVGRVNVWDRVKNEPEINLMSWPEIAELVKDGWEVGSHTRTHADLTRLKRPGPGRGIVRVQKGNRSEAGAGRVLPGLSLWPG